MRKETTPTEESITTVPLTGSKKIYVSGQLHDIKVAMREVMLSDTTFKFGKDKQPEKNPGVVVYDTSGPFTDPQIKIDVKKGIPKLRQEWILQRGDVEAQEGVSSKYGKERLENKDLDHLRFEYISKPLKAKKGMNASQMHYAKKRNNNSGNGIHRHS